MTYTQQRTWAEESYWRHFCMICGESPCDGWHPEDEYESEEEDE